VNVRSIAVVGLAVVALDQSTKMAARQLTDRTKAWEVGPFGLGRHENARSLGGTVPGAGWSSVAAGAVLTAAGLGAAMLSRRPSMQLAGILVAAGAGSNLIDRMHDGAVTDPFFAPFFVGNAADMAIVAGVATAFAPAIRLALRR
jgi:lipoprotein signal peptidase